MKLAKQVLESLNKLKSPIKEDQDTRSYLDISSLDSHDIAHLQDELEDAGLILGKDFFLKSGEGSSWITNAADEGEPESILRKYRVGEEEY